MSTSTQLAGVDPGLLGYVQLCDAPLAAPAGEAAGSEARDGRLLPGDGELPLTALLAAVPPGMPVAIEAPSLSLRGDPGEPRRRRSRRALARRATSRRSWPGRGLGRAGRGPGRLS